MAFVGAGVMMLAEGVPLHILAKPAAVAVGKALIKAAALAVAEQKQAGADHLWRAAQKGVVTAMLVAAAGAILGF